MADVLDDGEFWLPSEFLTDDDMLREREKTTFNKGINGNTVNSDSRFCFPSDFPCCGYPSRGPSALNSPVESLAGSTETESDEDDYLAGFTRDMARSLFQVQVENRERRSSVFATENPKTVVKSGSPQSPLCGMGIWSGCSAGSSPNGCSQVSSPAATTFNDKDDAWGLLYAAAGQMVKMKLNDEAKYGRRGLVGVPQKPNPPPLASKNSNVQALAQQIQANHFLQLKKQQEQQQQRFPLWERQVNEQQNGGRAVGFGNGRCSRPVGLPPPSGWREHHQAGSGSGMRAVFLGVGGSGGRRECSGTGVFLPRRNGVSSETAQRKSGCPTVLLPDRVVQALNRSFHDMGGCGPHPQQQQQQQQQQRFVGGLGGIPVHLPQQQKRSYRPQPAITPEVQLPQEWTY